MSPKPRKSQGPFMPTVTIAQLCQLTPTNSVKTNPAPARRHARNPRQIEIPTDLTFSDSPRSNEAFQ